LTPNECRGSHGVWKSGKIKFAFQGFVKVGIYAPGSSGLEKVGKSINEMKKVADNVFVSFIWRFGDKDHEMIDLL
jgi:hypothetical protein